MIKYFEACAGIGFQRRGLENALNNIYGNIEPTSESEGISEVSPKAILGYAILHENERFKKEVTLDRERTIFPETLVNYLTEKGIGQFEGTPMRPAPINWQKKLKGKALDYMIEIGAADTVSLNYGDMNKVDKLPEGLDIYFHSSPCQSVSVAGKNAGFEKGSGTRSSLAWDLSRLVMTTKDHPKVLIFENVKGMVSGKNLPVFESLVDEIKSIGYNCYWKVLNAKYCGVPQNRERVFFVAIRSDIDTGKFEFPMEFDTGLRLKDILLHNVPDKYYINNDKAKVLIQDLKRKKIKLNKDKTTCLLKNKGEEFAKETDTSYALLARDWKGFGHQEGNAVIEKSNNLDLLGNIYGEKIGTGFAGNVWNKEGISPALMTMAGGNRQPMVTDVPNEINKVGQISSNGSEYGTVVDDSGISATVVAGTHGYANTCIAQDLAVPVLTPDRLKKRQNGRRFKENGDPSFTLTSIDRHGVMTEAENNHSVYSDVEDCNIAIRKLTPEECFVLMGMTIDDCRKLREAGLSDTDLYKIAGNGLVTNCVQFIVEHLYKALLNNDYVTTDEKLSGKYSEMVKAS